MLVEGARIRRAESLPESLGGLARRQAVELTPDRFEADTKRLLDVIERTLGEAQQAAKVTREVVTEPAAGAGAHESRPPSPGSAPADTTSSGETTQGAATSTSRYTARGWSSDGRTPSGFSLGVVLTLLAAGLLLFWVNWPGESGTVLAWKDENLSGWEVRRQWNDSYILAPMIVLIGAIGAAWVRPMLGLTLSAGLYTLVTATVILSGGLSSDQTGTWQVTFVLVLVALMVGWPLRGKEVWTLRWTPLLAVPAAVEVVAVVLLFVADGTERNGYTWLEVTGQAALAKELLVLAVAATVVFDIGGRMWRTTFATGAATAVLLGLTDLAHSSQFNGSRVTRLEIAP